MQLGPFSEKFSGATKHVLDRQLLMGEWCPQTSRDCSLPHVDLVHALKTFSIFI